MALPSSVASPVAIAYDAVSQRFVVADDSTNTLKIVSEASGHATDLVSTALRKRRFEITFGQSKHAIAERPQASDNIASDIEPYDE